MDQKEASSEEMKVIEEIPPPSYDQLHGTKEATTTEVVNCTDGKLTVEPIFVTTTQTLVAVSTNGKCFTQKLS